VETEAPWNHAELIGRLPAQSLHLCFGAWWGLGGQHHLERALEQARLLQPPGALVGRIKAAAHERHTGKACPRAPGQPLLFADPRRREQGGVDPHMTPQHQAQHRPAGVEPVERRADEG